MDNNNTKKILIVAAHPDDEIIGPGATIAHHSSLGDEVWAMILGEGQTSRFDKRDDAPKELISELHKDTMSAAKILGIKRVLFENFPDNAFDSVPVLNITKAVEAVIDEFEPSVIYTHHGGDLNIDHRKTFEAVLTATRPMEGCPVKEIYAFSTLSSTEWSFGSPMGGGGSFVGAAFMPNVFSKVSETEMKLKLSAMKEYRSELRDFPHPRSLEMMEADMKRFGAIAGYHLAEAFECVRILR